MPGYEKTVSVIMAPDIRNPKASAELVIMGSEAFFSACLKIMVLSFSPLAFAVSM